jgi:hypothetical protein
VLRITVAGDGDQILRRIRVAQWIFDVNVKVEDEARVERQDEHCQE